VCSPFERRYVHHHPFPLDEDAIQLLAPLLEGEHDFSAFAASDDRDAPEKTKILTVYSSRVELASERLVYRISGSGFLKHMVRNIVGTLLEAGKANLGEREILAFMQNGTPKAGPTAPACGLFLVRVDY